MQPVAHVLNPHAHRGTRYVIPAETGPCTDAHGVARPPNGETVITTAVHGPRPRAVEPWKVRWCALCRHYEYDVGAHRGWVPLRGTVAAEVVTYLAASQRPLLPAS